MADDVTEGRKTDEPLERRTDSARLVLEWLRQNAAHGPISASLSKIAKETELKYSTVSRALQRLEGMGRIKLLPRRSATETNTICLMDGVDAVDLPAIEDDLHGIAARLTMVDGYITRLQRTIRELEAKNAELEERSELMKGTIVERKELPGGMVMFIIQK